MYDGQVKKKNCILSSYEYLYHLALFFIIILPFNSFCKKKKKNRDICLANISIYETTLNPFHFIDNNHKISQGTIGQGKFLTGLRQGVPLMRADCQQCCLQGELQLHAGGLGLSSWPQPKGIKEINSFHPLSPNFPNTQDSITTKMIYLQHNPVPITSIQHRNRKESQCKHYELHASQYSKPVSPRDACSEPS